MLLELLKRKETTVFQHVSLLRRINFRLLPPPAISHRKTLRTFAADLREALAAVCARVCSFAAAKGPLESIKRYF